MIYLTISLVCSAYGFCKTELSNNSFRVIYTPTRINNLLQYILDLGMPEYTAVLFFITLLTMTLILLSLHMKGSVTGWNHTPSRVAIEVSVRWSAFALIWARPENWKLAIWWTLRQRFPPPVCRIIASFVWWKEAGGIAIWSHLVQEDFSTKQTNWTAGEREWWSERCVCEHCNVLCFTFRHSTVSTLSKTSQVIQSVNLWTWKWCYNKIIPKPDFLSKKC